MALRAAGRSVTLVDCRSTERPRVGEILPPAVQPALAGLGLLPRFQDQGHLPSYVLRSAWGREEPYEAELTFHPYGPSWHVDRAAFDRVLLDAAEEQGASVARGWALAALDAVPGGWHVELTGPAGGRRVETRFVIDASGRAATAARKIARGPRSDDDGVALVGFLRAPPGPVVTLIEAAPDGWWYAGRLPSERIVAAYLTDADLLPRQPDRFAQFWRERLADTSLVAAHCAGADAEVTPRLLRAGTARLPEAGGDRWLAVGDAAVAFDPLSSQGVCFALDSGRRGGEAAARRLAGDRTAVAAYAGGIESSFRDYMRLRADYYHREARWPSSPFWNRRRATEALSA